MLTDKAGRSLRFVKGTLEREEVKMRCLIFLFLGRICRAILKLDIEPRCQKLHTWHSNKLRG